MTTARLDPSARPGAVPLAVRRDRTTGDHRERRGPVGVTVGRRHPVDPPAGADAGGRGSHDG